MCKHKWKECDRTYYYDYWGNKVVVIHFMCSKCGKVRKKKFW